MKNIMRVDAGVGGDIQKIETISWMLLLKVWDAREADLEVSEEDFVSPLVNLLWRDSNGDHVAEDLRWRTWAENPEGITGNELLSFVNFDLQKVFCFQLTLCLLLFLVELLNFQRDVIF